jgi:hypothetical protein
MRTAGLVLVVASLASGTRLWAQAAGTQATAAAKVLPAAAAGPGGSAVNPTPLQIQTEKLAAMADELKARVDKTNRNVLSVAVVQQAQAIEQYAHNLKQGSPKP